MMHLDISDVMIYELNYGQGAEILEVELISKTDEISFQYTIPAKQGATGRISILGNALKTATELDFNWFEGDRALTDKTSLWLSQATFTALKSKSNVEIAFRQGLMLQIPIFKMVGKTELTTELNGRITTLKALYLEDLNNYGYKIWVWDNPLEPLILKLDLGWTMQLSQLNQPN